MRLCSIASGSSGNCIYVGQGESHILIDAGISMKKIVQGLKEIEVSPEELSGILITHEHSDHILGLEIICNKYQIPIYATAKTLDRIIEKDKKRRLPMSLLLEVASSNINIFGFASSALANEIN